MSEKLHWGIIGTGGIAHAFARGLSESKTGKLVAVGSRAQGSADKFAAEFAIKKAYSSYEALLADPEVQAVYISTPHPHHAEWAIKSAEAKKHILCEKPLAMNWAEAHAIVDAARRSDVFLMEAFMYRCHPQTAKLIELVKAKVVGPVKVIVATFSFHWPRPFNSQSRLTSNALGGGGILDVGCYTASLARLVAGASMGLEGPAEPIDVKAVGHLESTGVDGYAIASLKFPGDILAQLSCGVQVNQDQSFRVYCEDGEIVVPSPWFANGEIKWKRFDQKDWEIISFPTERGPYALEADVVAEHLSKRQAPAPNMSWADTLGNMKTLDRWREQIGLSYESEKPENIHTLTRRPLKQKSDVKMTYGTVPGLSKPVSRLVLGADFAGGSHREFNVIADDYFEQGGNAFDTSWLYYSWGPIFSDKVLGEWMKNRGVRNDCVVLAKGAHTPDCNPQKMTKQLLESIEMLQTDHVDIYMLHRDNPDIPAAEFVDALNEHVRAGRVKAFGGSNWSIARVKEANAYAKSKGLAGFTVLSNNFALARMLSPIWAGCISSSDLESRAWLVENQMVLMPWSSQARGFFVDGRVAPDKRDDPDMVRCWYSEDNFKRLDRAKELAKKKGVPTVNISLAWVLHQSFPTFPLIGPRQISETHSCVEALGVKLTPEEVKWLDFQA